MARLIDARITVIGTENSARRFESPDWARALRARHIEVYEFSDGRRVWWFQTKKLITHRLATLSSRIDTVMLLVEYEDHSKRTKGLVKAHRGKIDHCQFGY